MEQNEELLDDWKDWILSPKELFPVSISDPNYFTGSLPESAAWADDFSHIDVAMFDPDPIKLEKDQNVDTSTPTSASAAVVAKTDSAGTNAQIIADRRALNKSKIRSAAPSSCLTVPPGINPTLLLDSPVMLSNSRSSPTTGTLVLPNHDKPLFDSPSLGINEDTTSGHQSSFRIQPPPAAGSSPCYSTVHGQNPTATDLAQSALESRNLASIQAQSALKQSDATLKNMDFDSPLSSNIQLDSSTMEPKSEPFHPSHFYGVGGRELKNGNEAALVVNTGAVHPSDGNHKTLCPSIGAAFKTTEDGYNWRKYGQKQVKGSEYPRSYYKCTHPSCLVKKKVERSHDGEITEIIYKGAHNHPKPQPSRRSTFGSALPSVDSSSNGEAKDEGSALWRDFQNGYNKDIKVGSDGQEITSSTSVLTDLFDPSWNGQGKAVCASESAETPELSSTLASHDEDDDDDNTTQGSVSLGEDDDDESDAKRRRKEVSVIGTVLGSRAVREPRVVVQIESDIDILDDGYRWRKYGQKVVKGNPNPRSYYKCTSAGCLVRKHVERASHDLKYVITTYEGKHNHEVPAARNSSGHANSGGGNVLPPGSSSQASSLALPRNPHPKPEPQDFIPHFDRKVEYNGDQLLRSNYIGNLSGGGGGASSFYPLKFPALTNPVLYSSFGMNRPNNPSPVLPHPGVGDLPVSLALNFPLPLNLSVGNFSRPPVRPMNMVPPPLFMSQQAKENDVKLLRPKPEHRDESFCDSSSTAINHNSGSAAYTASMYPGMMGNFLS